jgi:hypothetical protein
MQAMQTQQLMQTGYFCVAITTMYVVTQFFSATYCAVVSVTH